MSKIINVIPNDDYTLLIEFEDGSKILFNMKRLIKTMRYLSLTDIERFKNVRIKDKVISWDDFDNLKPQMLPLAITLDNILLMLRD
ncbi:MULTISPECIES: DUF2442 domain-containing protein [Clostridium]|uniref:DUF2442 domain-containing protein n=3 Tax=Clostridium TaxID=1485 RepID=D8GSM0_CLOLD|nr:MULTISPECIES: DUF2442 domain-containing protein [Clostridium]ADK14440.1 hypothetical protein CLJU_c13720 [Clostridium ljungdahlii DSM 13528]AGY77657.1 DUF2442 domain-containing protein [Clostridium autoethanogenum DSM 10061]ALU37796.1 hypothetical protein CLAU_3369 [Clostridium autoethanogenum DSM 10061]OAA88140.1 hypothetical protein WX45_03007 [Clostridium ljungdahlii DSM 13528]OVY49853.1 hypothetical protein WX72_03232 [Clostridium autoethanogenum]